jgi:hypothetical protein
MSTRNREHDLITWRQRFLLWTPAQWVCLLNKSLQFRPGYPISPPYCQHSFCIHSNTIMPVATANQTQTSPSSTRRGGKRGGHRGRDGHRGGVGKSRGRKDAVAPNEPFPNVQPTQSEAPPAPDTTEDAVVCHICAEPVKYYSVPKCDHRTCHVCALRFIRSRTAVKKLRH